MKLLRKLITIFVIACYTFCFPLGSFASSVAKIKLQEIRIDELGFTVSFYSNNNMRENTMISLAPAVKSIVGESGIVSQPVSIVTTTPFDSATISFDYDPDKLGTINESDLRIFYFNPDNRNLELVENQYIDYNNHCVLANVSHLSIYLLADINQWAKTWRDGLVQSIAKEQISKTNSNCLDIAYVIDSSGSMGPAQGIFSNPSDWESDLNNDRITQTKKSIDYMTDNDRAAVIDFDDNATLLQGLTNNKDLLKIASGRINSDGGTNIPCGINLALEELEKNGRQDTKKVIVFLTDGRNSTGDGDVTDELGRANELGVNIYTVGLGKNADRQILQQIADSTGGHYYYVDYAKDLHNPYDQIGGDIELIKDTDSDGDGIPDWVENKGYIIKGTLGKTINPTDPNNPDTDDDGIDDGDELGTVYYDSETKKCYVSPEPLVYNKPHNPYRSNPTIHADYDLPPVNVDVSKILSELDDSSPIKLLVSDLLKYSSQLGFNVEEHLNKSIKYVIEKVELFDITNEDVKYLLVGLVMGYDDNFQFGLAQKLVNLFTGKDQSYLESNYYYVRGKAFVDAVAMASFLTASVGSAIEAGKFLAASGAAGSFALATAPASGGTTLVGGTAVSVGALTTSGVLVGTSIITKALYDRSSTLLARDSELLSSLSHSKNAKKVLNNIVRNIDGVKKVVPKGYNNIDEYLKLVDNVKGYKSKDEFAATVKNVEKYLNDPANVHPTIRNNKYAGTMHNGVEYDVIGFPIFDKFSKFEVHLESKCFKLTRDEHFHECTARLNNAIKKGEVDKKLFTPDQLKAIEDGKSKIPALTWHHHQVEGKLQLVPEDIHRAGHTGGNAIWGIGND